MSARLAAMVAAACLLAAPGAAAERPEPRPSRSYFIKGYEVTVRPDGSRWLNRHGERVALHLAPGGEARCLDSAGRLLGAGRWDAKTGRVEGIAALAGREAELAPVVVESMRDDVVETGAEGDVLAPLDADRPRRVRSEVEFVS